ncbi:phosphoribosyltransferase [Microbacterium panaciterrae]|uniref:Phosphoribosyltransferase domain-containing protein n=1 Tax=Microbacterium panaciterrae TaxID=985759 RepID=A0ABP8PKS0_9MICO
MHGFQDRVDAGRRLAARLVADPPPDAVVLGLPRGGVPVAAEVARALGAPLDVLVVRKVGVPWHEELAMGAVGEEGATVRNPDVVRDSGVDEHTLRAAERRERIEVERRAGLFRGGRAPASLAGRTALIVDDGIATGATVRAACAIARARGAARVVVAVPVGPPDALAALRGGADPDADEVICLEAPDGFMSVGMHYVDFRQTSDAEVVALLAEVR